METAKLYLVKLRGLQYAATGIMYGESYVIAVNPNDAYQKVKLFLEDRDIGFTDDRELFSVTLLAENIDFPKCRKILFT